MTVPAWPSVLPPPERGSWQLSPQEARVKRQSEAGPPGFRRRFSAVARSVSLSVVLTRDLRAVFDRFHQETCAWGSKPFTMPDATTDGWPLWAADGSPLLDQAGTPLLMAASWLCLWGEQPPATSILGVEFRVAFSVVVMP